MTRPIAFKIVYSLCLIWSLIFNGGCGINKHIQRVDGHLITLYAIPPTLSVGEVQLAVRIQDPDFRILTDIASSLEVLDMQSGDRTAVSLKPGPGKDVRGWFDFPRAGSYRAVFTFWDAAGKTTTARFTLQIP